MISIHALREEGDGRCVQLLDQRVISIHALREEGDLVVHPLAMFPRKISIHALREEGDRRFLCSTMALSLFLSTPSARRATVAGSRRGVVTHISIHALREEGDVYSSIVRTLLDTISIHALREEGDHLLYIA